MKLKCLFVVGMLFVAMVAQAQSWQEVVYLKNGSIIRGCNAYDVHGFDCFYFSPSVGCRYALNDVCGLNVSIGYSWQNVRQEKWNSENSGGISFKVGVDF